MERLRQRKGGISKAAQDESLLPLYGDQNQNQPRRRRLRMNRRSSGLGKNAAATGYFLAAVSIALFIVLLFWWNSSTSSSSFDSSGSSSTIRTRPSTSSSSSAHSKQAKQQYREYDKTQADGAYSTHADSTITKNPPGHKPPNLKLPIQQQEKQQKQQLKQHPTVFHCRDGRGAGFQNDDYCDCLDGSDETTTSACSHILVQTPMFACEDEMNTKIFVSRVNDGIRDCPNGKDETILYPPQ